MPSFDPFVRAEAPGRRRAPIVAANYQVSHTWDPADSPKEMRCPRISPLTGRISRTACRRRGPSRPPGPPSRDKAPRVCWFLDSSQATPVTRPADRHRSDSDQPGHHAEDCADRSVRLAVGDDRGPEVELGENA